MPAGASKTTDETPIAPGLDSTDLAGAGKKDVVSANYPPGTENYITETSASIELTGDAEEQPSQCELPKKKPLNIPSPQLQILVIQNPRCIAKRDYEPEPGFQTCAIKTHRDQEPLAQMTSGQKPCLSAPARTLDFSNSIRFDGSAARLESN